MEQDNAKDLCDKDVLEMVSNFVNMENGGTTKCVCANPKITKRTFINRDGEFSEEEVLSRAISAEDDITSEICEVEFQNGENTGLVIVATNAKLPSIIAYIPNKGSELAMKQSGANELLHASKAAYLYKSLKTRELVDSLKQPTLQKISEELDVPKSCERNISDCSEYAYLY